MRTLLKNCRVGSEILNIIINKDIIEYLGKELLPADSTIDINGKMVIPGCIDPHVHVRDMKQSFKEDWVSAGKAALAGGTTTIFDMPNTNPPTINKEFLNIKRQAAKKSPVNCGFYIGATAVNLGDVEDVLTEQAEDVVGIKLFLAASSSNEVVKQNDFLKKFFSLAKKYDKPIAIHSEMQDCINKWAAKVDGNHARFHNQIRNRECAIQGTKLILELTAEVGNKLYVVHTSTSDEIEMIRQYKKDHQVYCEVTPHHLLLDESILEKVGNYGKVNPPIRTKADNQALWEGIADGTVDTIGTDHAPHGLDEKQKDYKIAPSGFPGLETSLPLLLNEYSTGKLSYDRLVELTSSNASTLFNRKKRGQIKEGFFADLVVVDTELSWKIEPEKFYTKAKYSPFMDMIVKGRPVVTLVNGELKYELNS